jgi:6-phosphofructokinase
MGMVMRGRTLMVGQSGGATAVINASLIGVLDGALAHGFSRVVGIRHGIEGLFRDDLVELVGLSMDHRQRIRQTPSAALGTGRHKLQDDELDRALSAFQRHDARAFIYIGGNDSADTAHRLHQAARATSHDLTVMSVPKTIDNDLPETDHCPGYGSIARFMANAVRDATYDTIASPQLYPVKFIEVMGRDAGWVAASGVLGFDADESELLPLIYLPERRPASADVVLSEIETRVRERGWAVAVVPETLRSASDHHLSGAEPDYVDRFGHPYFPSTGTALTRLVRERLGLRARDDKPGTFARMAMTLVSPVDLDEAYRAGWAAAERAAHGEADRMTTLERVTNAPYRCEIGAVPLTSVANRVRELPDEFIGDDGRSLTPAYRDYALPLLGPNPVQVYGRL